MPLTNNLTIIKLSLEQCALPKQNEKLKSDITSSGPFTNHEIGIFGHKLIDYNFT